MYYPEKKIVKINKIGKSFGYYCVQSEIQC